MKRKIIDSDYLMHFEYLGVDDQIIPISRSSEYCSILREPVV
jgi:hypothetical protein